MIQVLPDVVYDNLHQAWMIEPARDFKTLSIGSLPGARHKTTRAGDTVLLGPHGPMQLPVRELL
jgi:hypothetical protein